jgi:hypothetical protein
MGYRHAQSRLHPPADRPLPLAQVRQRRRHPRDQGEDGLSADARQLARRRRLGAREGFRPHPGRLAQRQEHRLAADEGPLRRREGSRQGQLARRHVDRRRMAAHRIRRRDDPRQPGDRRRRRHQLTPPKPDDERSESSGSVPLITIAELVKLMQQRIDE